MRSAWRPMLAVAALAGGVTLWLMRPEQMVPAITTGTVAIPDRVPADTRAEAVALQSLRARQRQPDAVMFREVRVWRFGPEDERAVCGVIESRDLPGGAVPFVVRVVLPAAAGGPGRPPQGAGTAAAMPILEDGPGMIRPAPEARRRFCRDGAAVPTPAPGPAATPPLAAAPPSSATGAEASPAAALADRVPFPPPPGSDRPSGEQVTVLSNANLRGGPLGGEPVLSVIPRGTVLSVYGRAPGGWVRVGEGEPWGWIHGSMLAEGTLAGR